MLWLAMAQEMQPNEVRPPVPTTSPSRWVTPADYPAAAASNGESGRTRFRLALRPDGALDRGEITVSSGSASLDAQTCAVLARRATFRPATDATGGRVYGTYAGVMTWWRGSDARAFSDFQAKRQNSPPFDLEISVDRLPAGSGDDVSVVIGLAVDDHDIVTGCGAVTSKFSNSLGALACRQAVARLRPGHLSDALGAAVASYKA